MNWDHVQANWEQMKGKIRAKWGKLTDDDLEMIQGKKDVLIGKIRERYAMQKDLAEKQVDELIDQIPTSKH